MREYLETYLCENDDAILTIKVKRTRVGLGAIVKLTGDVHAANTEMAGDECDTLNELLESLGTQLEDDCE